ncbi:methyltransferase domain-containing protein [Ferroplasma sp.]|uniref:class I SAM-dependent methyltransferase n=1 Tax=Ferroplasma sp. TaxID=2591003 RepID=UPI002628744C|nr:methyltransferase domain-containing protein [Ferroplasma sp.]
MDEYDKTRDFFAKNSGYYSKSESHAGDNDLNILVDMLELKGNMIGLDAATGAGFTAVKMAQKISKVYALDMVDNMLEETKKLAEKEGLKNIITVKGYADSMPFEDKKFNVVTSRRAPHHFRDKNKFAAECYRVLQEGGRIGIDDMTAPDNVIKNLNEMERIRDPSHMCAASPEEWMKILEDAGFGDIKSKIYSRQVTFEQWLNPVDKSSDEGIKSLEYLVNGRNAFTSAIRWDGKSFYKSWIVIVGTKL